MSEQIAPLAAASGQRRLVFEHLSHESADNLRALAWEVTIAEARERERIAHGLHDDIGQSLALVMLKLNELSAQVAGLPMQGLVDEIKELVVQTSRATRLATFELSCPVLQQLGLQPAIESLSQRMLRLFGLRVHLNLAMPSACLPHATSVVVFRVIRELLSNAQRHAHAGNAWVDAQADAQLCVVVSDDGIGFDPRGLRHRFSPEGGFGLFSAGAQMRAVGGRLDIDSAPGEGTRAVITVPLAADGIGEQSP